MENVRMVEYTVVVGNHKGEMVAMYDGDKVPLNVVHELIKNNMTYHSHIIFCTKQQYLNVFESMIK